MTIDNYEDVIDSRDVIDRITELADELMAVVEVDDIEDVDFTVPALDDYAVEMKEYANLVALAGRASSYAEDWLYGETLIRDSYFVEYAQQLAEDIGAIPDDASWPATCIDWDEAASDLQMDYTCVDFDGVTYWVR